MDSCTLSAQDSIVRIFAQFLSPLQRVRLAIVRFLNNGYDQFCSDCGGELI